MTTHKKDTTLNSCLLLCSLQFKQGWSEASAAPCNVQLICGYSLSNATFFGQAMSRFTPQTSTDWNNNNCTTVNSPDLTFCFNLTKSVSFSILFHTTALLWAICNMQYPKALGLVRWEFALLSREETVIFLFPAVFYFGNMSQWHVSHNNIVSKCDIFARLHCL